MNQIKKLWNKYYDYIMIAVIYGVLHAFMHTDYWDDLKMAPVLKQCNYNLFPYLWYIWNEASSTLFQYTVEVVIEALPNFIWKILDVIMIEIIYCYFAKVVKLLTANSQETSLTPRLWIVLVFLSFPYSLFATAGWMTTTIVYTWALSAFFYSLYVFLFSVKEERNMKLPTYILYGVAVLYAANCNLLAISMLIIFLFVYITCKAKNKTFRILFVEGMIGSVLNIIMFFTSPGNRVRNIEDARHHNTAELLNMSIGGHLRMGINSTFYHFISVPNIILFTLCVMLVVCSFYKTKKNFIRLISSIPLIFDIFWTGYMFVAYTITNRTLTYIYPDALFETSSQLEQFCALVSAILMVLCICYLVAYLTDFSNLSWFLVGFLLFFGLFPCVAIGFTTTVSASIIRVAGFFYFSIMLCVCILGISYNIFKNKLFKYTFYTLGWIGGLLNILQVIRHIIVYG
ncbi:MAG: hypothetical protein NC321_12055 [Clostridium sp.]|nr:hypothetical protein [Clostridium sp.]